MSALLTSDLHLSQRPRDEYRFDLFPWLVKQAKKHGCTNIFILGDLTDEKDRHTSIFVHKVIDSIKLLVDSGLKVGLLKGNHDYLAEAYPFFAFLELLSQSVRYYVWPTLDVSSYKEPVLWLPFARDGSVLPSGDTSELRSCKYVFLHQTVTGARASNGQVMDGVDPQLFSSWSPKLYSGDIHVPQIVGDIEYVGSPYHVHFGDEYKPRVILLNDKSATDLHFPTIKKQVIRMRDLEDLPLLEGFKDGDQVKVVMTLQRKDLPDWETYRAAVINACKKAGVDLCGVELDVANSSERNLVETIAPVSTPEDIFAEFCKREKVTGRTKKVGKELLDG